MLQELVNWRSHWKLCYCSCVFNSWFWVLDEDEDDDDEEDFEDDDEWED